MRKLGKQQALVLDAMRRCGNYHATYLCGWKWDTETNTKKILDALVKRGYVEKDSEGWYSLIKKEK